MQTGHERGARLRVLPGKVESMGLPMWVVYAHPRDSLVPYIARLWIGESATNSVITGQTLDEVRRQLPPGLAMLARHDDDDPTIVETWL